jgi:uncharacterized protein (TIGR02284 family)|nr:PA2169 family four-helix-bundle protein [uncultured Allomuricauda sp.]
MNNDIKEIENHLNEIVRKNEDAIKGYKKAAENAKEVGLQNYFQNKARERSNFLNELKAATPALNLENDMDGSAKGAMHRAWMDTKAFFSSDNDESMLEEAIRGDKAAVENYNEVLANTHLPINSAAVIRKQRDWIVQDLEANKTLEDIM